jgi:hypothetical protein
MDLCTKYKPLYLSELEIEYPKLVEYLNSNSTFIVNGPKFSGKSTIVKLYLDYLNYDYLLIDDFNLSKDNLIEKFKYRTKSVFSYFYNKKYIIVVDNYELFDSNVKDFIIENSMKFPFLIITNKYLNSKINYIRIHNYSMDYILNLYSIIHFLEKGYNCKSFPELYNISQMYSLLEFNINVSNESSASNKSDTSNDSNDNNDNNESNYNMFFDKFDYKFNDLVREKNFENKLYILDKINSYNVFQHNLIYNYKSIDSLSDCYNNLSESLDFLSYYNKNTNLNYNCLEFYSILSIIGTSYTMDDFKIHKENFQYRKKKILNYI